MQSSAKQIEDYLKEIPEDRKEAMMRLRAICQKQIKGSEERMSYGMIGYMVPFERYPNGYHCTPELPLPFISIASQKNFIAIYHMGVYSKPELLNWFVAEFPKHSKKKLDMGKSCIRFKKVEDIPFELIEELMSKMRMDEWIQIYSSILDTRKK
jgi:uncharacterized protein YdhG (YjbR/CyaY superfamily)